MSKIRTARNPAIPLPPNFTREPDGSVIFDAAAWTASYCTPWDAPSLFLLADDALHAGDLVAIWARESFWTQNANGNLLEQIANLEAYARRRRLNVLDVCSAIGSGRNPQWFPDFYALWEAVHIHGAKILGECPSRFLRSPFYHSKERPTAVPTVGEADDMLCQLRGQMVVLSYDDRSVATKRGMEMKGRMGGRGNTISPAARNRDRLRTQACALSAEGWSLRDIATRLNVSKSVVGDWLA